MNSSALKNKFPRVYQDFFQKSQKVVSAPHSFFWTGDFSGFFGGLTVLSKLPLRFYVGLQQIKKSKFEIEKEFLTYSSTTNQFVKTRLDNYLVLKLTESLSEKLSGYKIHFLSEVTLGTSLGSLGALSACLAWCEPRRACLCELTSVKEDVFTSAWSYAKKLQQGRTSGATTFVALSDSPYPIVFYSKGKEYWGKSLDQIFNLKSHPVWPIDFGLIFSGNLVCGAAVIASAQEIKNILENREADIKKILKSSFENSFWQTYLNMLNQIGGQNLIAFSEIFKKGAKTECLEFFFNTINQYQNLLHFLEISTPAIDKIYSAIHKMADKTENQTGSGAKITGVGKGGEVLFAVPYGQYRQQITKFCQNRVYNLDYTSWDDGFEERGTILEQDIKNNCLSPHIKKDSLLLTVYEKSNVKTTLPCPAEIPKLAKKIDLLLDCVSGKILHGGKNLNSTSLPSQKAAILILQKLLESEDKILKNNDLPKTYSENRYDLQSKITIPLSRLVPLQFEIKGGMYENYTLSLKPFDIKIGILEKII